MEAGRDGEEGLAGACLADQGDDLDVVVQKRVEGEGLLQVAREYAPDPFLVEFRKRHHAAGSGVVAADGAVLGVTLLGKEQVLVRIEIAVQLQPSLAVEAVDDVAPHLEGG